MSGTDGENRWMPMPRTMLPGPETVRALTVSAARTVSPAGSLPTQRRSALPSTKNVPDFSCDFAPTWASAESPNQTWSGCAAIG